MTIDIKWLTNRVRIPENHRENKEWMPEFRDTLTAIRTYCSAESEAYDPNLLEAILEREGIDLTWSYYQELAAAGVLLRGPKGVEQLATLLRAPQSRFHLPAILIRALWRAATNQSLVQRSDALTAHLATYSISDSTTNSAMQTLNDLIIESRVDPVLFSEFVSVVSADAIGRAATQSSEEGFPKHFLGILAEASISLTHRLLDEFRTLIESELPEETYQVFLKENSILLDPLSAETIAKHRLGTEFVTDFIIRRHDYRYIAVEIEKPQDSLY
jgi:hypothetical protein